MSNHTLVKPLMYYLVLAFCLVLVLLAIGAVVGLKSPPRSDSATPVVVDLSFADTTAQFYRIGDSVYIRVMFVPHGKGVIVEIQPVKKIRKESK